MICLSRYKGACYQPWPPNFNPWYLHGRKRDAAPTGYPLLPHTHCGTCTFKHIHAKKKSVMIKKKKLVEKYSRNQPLSGREKNAATLMLAIPTKALDHSQRARKSGGLFFSSVVFGWDNWTWWSPYQSVTECRAVLGSGPCHRSSWMLLQVQ